MPPPVTSLNGLNFKLDAVRLYSDVHRLETPEHEMTRFLLSEWESRRAAGTPLNSRDLPSRTFAAALPNRYLMEPVTAEGADWRFRLVGTTIAAAFPADPTGKAISELYAAEKVEANAYVYKHVLGDGEPVITKGRVEGLNLDFMIMEFIHLPIETGNEGERLLLGGVFEHGREKHQPAHPRR
ncbi:PAS domain-containing protein [Tepidicaulis sp. LMO-SS28]|uniref:PAS domain-containing protein n=1 Tax=Tepidicaulis sp. LMO-SS28 TaxID=3447455 RepID=UPI003EDF951A